MPSKYGFETNDASSARQEQVDQAFREKIAEVAPRILDVLHDYAAAKGLGEVTIERAQIRNLQAWLVEYITVSIYHAPDAPTHFALRVEDLKQRDASTGLQCDLLLQKLVEVTGIPPWS